MKVIEHVLEDYDVKLVGDAAHVRRYREDVAATATALYRHRAILQELEWSGSNRIDYDDTAEACPACNGISPESWQAKNDSTYGEPVGHLDDCKLAALLRASRQSGGAEGKER